MRFHRVRQNTAKLFIFYFKDANRTTLNNSTTRGYLPGVQYILKENLLISVIERPFMWACTDGYIPIMKEFVKCGVNVAHNRNLPLRYATHWGRSTEGIRFLIEAGCVIDGYVVAYAKGSGKLELFKEFAKDPTVKFDLLVRESLLS